MNLTRLRTALFLALTLAGTVMEPAAAEEAKPKPDPWAPIRQFEGEWEGTAEGESGSGTVRRTYAFILERRYLHERNTSTYAPKDPNGKGEVHEHWSFFSHDRARDALVLRQFHEEGFVNTYVLNKAESGQGRLVFDSETFENFDNKWRARETYEIRSAGELVETFELGPPGKPLETYSRTQLRRAGRPGG